MAEFGRVLTAMVTPFDGQGNVDYARACELAEALIASGSNGLVLSGTTGESPTLTSSEKVRLFREVRDAIGARATIVAGTCNYNTAESIEASLEAKAAGVDGILGTVPYYNKPPQQGLYAHFEAIARAVDLPMILYNVPSRTVTNMLPETTIRLSRIPNIVGIKEASGNFDAIAQIIEESQPGFRVWSGDDIATLPLLSLGGYGIVSVASHLVGAQIQEMIGHFVAGRTGEASALHRKLRPFFNALFVTTNPIPLKYALRKVGFDVGSPRLPLVEPDERSAAVIDAALAAAHIDLPVPARA
ncbi:MAG: 4-hydroxy-tetrahydrodipicolinate synthase [Chloroflexi bacterium]|nr:4-hydroxy-tetrahydrodipicolinate synthase [Chloroflexota bacterium]